MYNRDNFIGRVVYGGGFLFDFAKWIIMIVILISIIHFFIGTIYFVDGQSMDPTFATGEIGVLDKISYDIYDPARGDIVVVNYPGDPENKRYVKRVIGMPGDTIEVKDGSVYINKKKIARKLFAKRFIYRPE